MKIIAIMVVIIAIVFIHWIQTSHSDALNNCQENHSYDICVYSLR